MSQEDLTPRNKKQRRTYREAKSSKPDDDYLDHSYVKLIQRLLPNIHLQPVLALSATQHSDLFQCYFHLKLSADDTSQIIYNKDSKTCWIPRDEVVKEKPGYRSRKTIVLNKIKPVLLRPGFGGYLKRMHGEVDPSATWTLSDTKFHNQRLLVAARFVHFVCTNIGIPIPTIPEDADRILVNAVGNSVVFSRFTQAIVASGAAASTEANHAQALVHASNYAKEQLSFKASTADEGALVITH